MTDFCMVFVTLPDMVTGQKIAEEIVSERLCACANLSRDLTSIFTWKSKLEQSSEVLMIIKTTTARLPQLESRIRAMHPYEVFEFVALPVLYGNQQYLDWIKESVE